MLQVIERFTWETFIAQNNPNIIYVKIKEEKSDKCDHYKAIKCDHRIRFVIMTESDFEQLKKWNKTFTKVEGRAFDAMVKDGIIKAEYLALHAFNTEVSKMATVKPTM